MLSPVEAWWAGLADERGQAPTRALRQAQGDRPTTSWV